MVVAKVFLGFASAVFLLLCVVLGISVMGRDLFSLAVFALLALVVESPLSQASSPVTEVLRLFDLCCLRYVLLPASVLRLIFVLCFFLDHTLGFGADVEVLFRHVSGLH